MSRLRPDRKQARREAAQERQVRYDALTTDEKRAHLLARGCPSGSNEMRKLDGK